MSSDTEESFFDAESDLSLSHRNSKVWSDSGDTADESDESHMISLPVAEDLKDSLVSPKENDPELNKTRQQLEGLRCRLLNKDEEEEDVHSPDSPASSVDEIYAATKPMKFKVVEHDTVSIQSMMSLGRVGLILGTPNPDTTSLKDVKAPLFIKNVPLTCKSTAASRENITRETVTRSKSVSDLKAGAEKEVAVTEVAQVAETVSPEPPKLNFTEPDIVASTKSPVPDDSELMKEPIAPPRRKRRDKTSRAVSQESLAQSPDAEGITSSMHNRVIPSPGATVEALTHELEKSLAEENRAVAKQVENEESFQTVIAVPKEPVFESRLIGSDDLDVSAAKRGSYVVKPQDEPSSKASGSQPVILEDQVDSAGPANVHLVIPGGSIRKESLADQPHQSVRLRSSSGKSLSEKEILEQMTVLNLDTGERVPLSEAEDKIPKCVNPLSLHIMRLTSEYVSNSAGDKERDSDEESIDIRKPGSDLGGDDGDTISLRKKTLKFGRVLGSTVRKTIGKAKRVAHSRHKEEPAMDLPDEANVGDQFCKMKASSSHKGPYEFDTIQCIQDLSGEHGGPVWCMKFSHCGRLLATAGQDKVLRIWVLKSAYHYFLDMRTRYSADNKVSPTPSSESLKSQHSGEDFRCHSRTMSFCQDQESMQSDPTAPFMPKPFCVYSGHTADVLDLSWSKNYFVLSSSMDKTVRLWHISRKECLCCFQHIDFVTAIAFHPKDDRYFLSGSLDGKLRLWHIPDKKVALWNELDGQTKLITAANFCQNGNFAVVGSYDGRCIFYTTEQLKYHTQIHVRSTRGKNAKGRKITGIEALPGEDKILVTSNDSRLRLYDLRDCSPSCKYKGCVNTSSQIRAGFSHDGKYIICGSENQCIYMWKTHHDYAKFSSARRDRNNYWEAIRAHNAVVTSAIFAPEPQMVIDYVEHERKSKDNSDNVDLPPMQRSGSQSTVRLPGISNTIPHAGWAGYVIVSADYNGSIKVFMNKTKPKHSSLPASALV